MSLKYITSLKSCRRKNITVDQVLNARNPSRL